MSRAPVRRHRDPRFRRGVVSLIAAFACVGAAARCCCDSAGNAAVPGAGDGAGHAGDDCGFQADGPGRKTPHLAEPAWRADADFLRVHALPGGLPGRDDETEAPARVGDGALRAVRVVLISVDGERDTPAVMKQYLASFSPAFIGLTGNPRVVTDIAARFSAVAFKEQPDKTGNYQFFHSSQVFLVDKAGRLRASFSDASLENMVTVTRLVLDEKGG